MNTRAYSYKEGMMNIQMIFHWTSYQCFIITIFMDFYYQQTFWIILNNSHWNPCEII